MRQAVLEWAISLKASPLRRTEAGLTT